MELEVPLDMRPINGFLEECCLLARNARYGAIDLYLTYVHWCLQGGVPVQDQFTFMDMLECYGLKYRERKNRSWVKGIAVRPEFRPDT
jgi:hypothetical protein